MFTHRFPPPPAAFRRALAWTTIACGGIATLGLAWRAILLTIAVALGGCAALPSGVDRPASYARSDIADARLAGIAAASTPADAGPCASGFRLLSDGVAAFDARIALIRGAEKSLDVPYYLVARAQFLEESVL